MKRYKWTIMFAVGLTAFTIYAALDTFVIASAYQSSATEMNLSMFESSTDQAADNETKEEGSAEKRKHPGRGKGKKRGRFGDSDKESEDAGAADEETAEEVTPVESSDGLSYEDDNISIKLKEYTTNDTVVYVADVTLSSAQYLKTAFAQDTYGKNIKDTTSEISEANDAILAINGDYYGAQESGYVIRNGVIYRDVPSDAELLCIYSDGSMQVINQSDVTAQELIDDGVWQAFSFGPALVTEGEIAVTVNEETGKAKASNPRTAIGVIDELHYLFVVSDGRTDESEGLSLYELASFMKQLGAETAYNLDGGGSSTMVFRGEVINNPTTSGNSIKEREVSDIVYIG